MKARRLALGILLGVLLLSIVAVSTALGQAYRLGGEWSAVVMIADVVVLGYASVMVILGVALRRRLANEVARSRLALVILWSVLGPVPTALYSVFHCIKMFA